MSSLGANAETSDDGIAPITSMPSPQVRWMWIVAGISSAALLAVAAAKPWWKVPAPGRLPLGVRPEQLQADVPLALAFALVVLAAWGPILAARGWARRAGAAIGALAAMAVGGSLGLAPKFLTEQLDYQLRYSGIEVNARPTVWFGVATFAALVALTALAWSWWTLPMWPSMDRKYDRPNSRPPAEAGTPLDLWNAMDEGVDPTESDSV